MGTRLPFLEESPGGKSSPKHSPQKGPSSPSTLSVIQFNLRERACGSLGAEGVGKATKGGSVDTRNPLLGCCAEIWGVMTVEGSLSLLSPPPLSSLTPHSCMWSAIISRV